MNPNKRFPGLTCGVLAVVGFLGACSSAAQPTTGGSGGARASGGASASGGAPGTGGKPGSGGSPGSGGTASSGGAPGSGGATGGSGPGSGGTSGGQSGGGNGSGGTPGGSGGTPAGSGGTPGGSGGSAGGGGLVPTPSACAGGTYPAPALSGLTPTRIDNVPPADGFNGNGSAAFTIIEGPVWTGDALFVSEISYMTQMEASQPTVPPPSRILRVTAAGQVTVAVADAGSNGLAVDGTGALLAADHKNGAITRFALPNFTPSPVVTGYQNMRFDSPNDLVLGADGTLYFSDPDWQAPKMRPQTATRLYRLAPGAKDPVVIDEMRRQPNGVALSPKGDALYLTSMDGVYKYPVNGDGTVGAGSRLSQAPAEGDGMAMDCAGNLYIASGTMLVVLSPTGAQLGQINVAGVQSVTNAAFGGSDRKTLYITALGSTASMGGAGTGGRGGGNPGGGGSMMPGLFKVTMNVPGYPY